MFLMIIHILHQRGAEYYFRRIGENMWLLVLSGFISFHIDNEVQTQGFVHAK